MANNDFSEVVSFIDEPDLSVVVDNREEYMVPESLTLGDCDTETASIVGVFGWRGKGVR